MQIQSSAATLRFNFTSEPQRQALYSRLSEGQVLEARVLDQLDNGRFAVRVMGHTLMAESRLSLMPGQQVQVRVDSLGPPLVLSLTGQVHAEEMAFNRAFQSLGLPDNAINRAIVRGLIAQGRSIDREQVQTLRSVLTNLQGPLDFNNAEQIEAIIARTLFLQNQGIPVTPDTLSMYLSQLPSGALGGLFHNLGELLKSLRLKTSDTPLSAFAERLSNALPDVSKLTGESLRQLIANLGLDIEGRMAAYLAEGQSDLPEEIRNSLRSMLFRLQQQLDSLSLNTSEAQTLHTRLSETLKTLDTLQAANLPTEHREALFFQIPFLMDNQPTTADLQIFYQKKGHGHLDPDNLRFTLTLDLTGLGHVCFDLTVVNKCVACRIYTEDDQRAAFLQNTEPELKTILEQSGYTVADIACRVATQHRETPVKQSPTVGLDFRV